jgi:hypothetical protein
MGSLASLQRQRLVVGWCFVICDSDSWALLNGEGVPILMQAPEQTALACLIGQHDQSQIKLHVELCTGVPAQGQNTSNHGISHQVPRWDMLCRTCRVATAPRLPLLV